METVHRSFPEFKRPPAGGVSPAAPARATARTEAAGEAPAGPPWYRGKRSAASIHAVDEATGELHEFDPETGRQITRRDKGEKFTLQTHAGYLLKDLKAPKGGGFAVGRCNRFLGMADEVTVLRGEHGSHFAGLVQCGSVWHCPVCAAKLAERRREELQRAVSACQDQGGSNAMVTLTFPHTRGQDLKEMLASFGAALKRYRASRAYKAAVARVVLVGHVRGLEVTWGQENGWHPHCHELLFLERPVLAAALVELKAALFKAWKSACEAVGLGTPSYQHGVDVREALSAGAYLAKFGIERKWGPDAELARSHIKKGREGRLSPWDLLARSYQARVVDKTRDVFGGLWQEYAQAFHGQRQLHWSKGLKALYALPEVSDEELVQQPEPGQNEEVVVIDFRTWRELFAVAKVDRRGQLLDLADSGGREAVDRFIQALRLEARFGDFWRDDLKWDGPEILRRSR